MERDEISALIIDDDSDAINLLEMYLRQFTYIRVVGRSTNAIEGLKLIINKLPDLLFLDIDMPDMTGLQVAESVKIKNSHTEIVFTTAYQHYAYRALPIEPLDFLTKPFFPDDLEKVISKYILKVEKKKYDQKLDLFIQSQSNPPKITLPTVHSFLILDINDIVFVKANLNRTKVYLQDGTVETTTRNLISIIRLINSPLIFQIHKGSYVNFNYIQRIDRKRTKCIVRFNSKFYEEPISKSCIVNFEKFNIFPIV
jgi:DNA-binding LytR/AlgR family response regulator